MSFRVNSGLSSSAGVSPQRYLVTSFTFAFFIFFFQLSNDCADAEPPRLVKEMNGNGEIAVEPFAKCLVARYIRVAFIRPVDEKWFSNELVPCNEAPITAVIAVVAIIAHDQITVGRNRHRTIVVAYL